MRIKRAQRRHRMNDPPVALSSLSEANVTIPRPMAWRLLRDNRDFRLLYFGTLISLGGDWFLTVALLDLVLQLTGSATLASLMLLCQTLPIFIFTPIAGHVIDRVDRSEEHTSELQSHHDL